eukprot:GGOE01005705.1.p1 GENE.GGOE01005705.1~~GGOE01005705.1.p1  ORF type:complete len:605 (+),score=132.61 GGOE01005705.1:19-1833(+)
MVLVDDVYIPSSRGAGMWDDIESDEYLRIQRCRVTSLSSSMKVESKGRKFPFHLKTCTNPKYVVAVAKTRPEIQRDYEHLRKEIERRGLSPNINWPALIAELKGSSSGGQFSQPSTRNSNEFSTFGPSTLSTESSQSSENMDHLRFASPTSGRSEESALLSPEDHVCKDHGVEAGPMRTNTQTKHNAALVNIGVYLVEAQGFFLSFSKSVGTNYYVAGACSITSTLLWLYDGLPEVFVLAAAIALAIVLKRGRERHVADSVAAESAAEALRQLVVFLDWLGAHSGATLILRLLVAFGFLWLTFVFHGLGLLCWLLAFNFLATSQPQFFDMADAKRRSQKMQKARFARAAVTAVDSQLPTGGPRHIPHGYLGGLTMVQQEALERFRAQVAAKVPTFHESFRLTHGSQEADRMCLRWLRMNKFNEEQAFKACMRCVEWRKDFHGVGVNNLTATMCRAELDRRKLVFGGYSEGLPVFWVRAHVHSRQDTDPKALELAAVYLMENEMIPKLQTSLPGPAGESFILVADLSHFRHSNLDLEAAKQVVMTLQQNYPEYLHTALIIEPTKLFSATWKVRIRGWFDPATLAKVQFIRQEDVEEWLPKESISA